MKCKHEFRQVTREGKNKASFYCIKCLEITEHKEIDDYDFSLEVGLWK